MDGHFCPTFLLNFFRGISCCQSYRGVCNSELTVMQELIENKSHLTTQATVTVAKTVHINVILPMGL